MKKASLEHHLAKLSGMCTGCQIQAVEVIKACVDEAIAGAQEIGQRSIEQAARRGVSGGVVLGMVIGFVLSIVVWKVSQG